MFDSMLKVISCPVCFNSLRPPVAVCENGHSTCPDCKAKVPNCPLCSKPFLNLKNRQLDEVLEVIPHLCRFEGCQVFVKTDDDHEKWCSYRKTDCKMDKCNWIGCVRDLAEHSKKDHESKHIMKEKNINWSFTGMNNFETGFEVFSPILAHGQVFWKHATSNQTEKILKIAFYCEPVGKVLDSFQITVTLKKGCEDKKPYSTSTLMLPENMTNEEENCICLPFFLVRNFISSEGKLSHDTTLEKK